MTLTLELPAAVGHGPNLPEHILLSGISWETFERLRDETDAAGQRRYFTYDDGDLEIMSPLPKHERVKELIGKLLTLYAIERRIPIASLGQTTWKRHDLLKALEPDQCFYVQSELAVRGKDDIELPKDPPPDLAVEVDITSRSLNRQKIYAALGVAEIWRYDGKGLHFLCLKSGQYAPAEKSLAFPELHPSDLFPFIEMRLTHDEIALLVAWQEWLRQRAAEL
jgi:Uma2 family endonuclease